MNLFFSIPIIACIFLGYIYNDTLLHELITTEPQLKIWNMSIGQGDSILIKTPEQRYILVDGGPDGEMTLRTLQGILPPLTNHIDILILSHPHKDHIQGLFTILERMKVGMILAPDSDHSESAYIALEKKAREHHVPFYRGVSDHDLQIDAYTTLDILSPSPDHHKNKNINNNSLTFLLAANKSRSLFMGDAELSLEKELIQEGYDLSSYFLKGGHHGSKTATSSELLDASEPKVVVYSNGIGNSFNHPHSEVLSRLQQREIPFWNTSISGTVELDCPIDTSTCSITPPEHETL